MNATKRIEPPRFLVADDEAQVRELLRYMCSLIFPESEYVSVSNGAEAMKLLEERDFDILITDWMMPVMSGLELLDSIRDKSMIKIVFSGSGAMGESYEKAKQSGASIFFSKPDAMALCREIKKIYYEE